MKDKACQKDYADRDKLHELHKVSSVSRETQTVLYELIDPRPAIGQQGKGQDQTADGKVISCDSSPDIRLDKVPGKNIVRLEINYSSYHATTVPLCPNMKV